jgi:hypothetical protein
MNKGITIDDIDILVKEGKLTHSHTAMFRGYVSRKDGSYARPYKGRYGRGVVVYSPNWGSTRYSFVSYYLES